MVPRAVVPRDGSARRVVVAQSLLSSRFGWLLWMAPGHTGTIRAFLLAALETPGVAAQIAADRQADRMVGSLCWMLGIRRAEIGHNARAAEARAVEAWTAPEAGRFSERDIDEAWGIVWARPVAGGVVLENSGVV